jgi:hypothetical protein
MRCFLFQRSPNDDQQSTRDDYSLTVREAQTDAAQLSITGMGSAAPMSPLPSGVTLVVRFDKFMYTYSNKSLFFA